MSLDYKNILVINLMHIGDLMLTTPILRTLRLAYPRARLSLLADKKLKDLVFYNENIDECLLIDKKGKDDKLPAFLRYIGYVRSKKFDLVINLHRNERASAIAAFSGAGRIVGYAKPFFSWFFADVLPNEKAVMHQIKSHFKVLTETNVVTPDQIVDYGLEMVLPPGAKESAEKIWQMAYPKDRADGLKVVALNVGASWPTKRWLPEYFAEVADALVDRGYHVAFLGSKDDNPLVDNCTHKMQHREDEKDADGNPLVHRFTGKMTLGELAAIIKKCVLFITTDSGPMHVGVAMHTPIIVMFGASPVLGFSPYDAKDISLKSPAVCHPCDKHICPKKGAENFMCMKRITPAAVLKCAADLLAKYEDQVGDMPYPKGEYDCQVIVPEA